MSEFQIFHLVQELHEATFQFCDFTFTITYVVISILKILLILYVINSASSKQRESIALQNIDKHNYSTSLLDSSLIFMHIFKRNNDAFQVYLV